MFQQHNFIYTTFHPADRAKALKAIAALAATNPDRVFEGRHETSVAAKLAEALECSSLTLILESERTAQSVEVCDDIRASLAKNPPNQILRIVLPEEEAMAADVALSKSLVDLGVEVVLFDDTLVDDALIRLDLLSKHEPKLRVSATTKPDNGGCIR